MPNLSGRPGVWKAAGATALASVVVVTLAYRLPTTIIVDMGNAPLSALLTEDFHDAEEGYRWTRGVSRFRLLDPGITDLARLDILLAGFRPPGSSPPLLVIESGGRSLRETAARRAEHYELETQIGGSWRSTLEVTFRSDTFSPGAGDDRTLGVRVHEVRLTLPRGAWPPIDQIAAVMALALMGLIAVSRWRESLLAGLVASLSITLTSALGLAFERSWATIVIPGVAIAIAAAIVVGWLLPRFRRFVALTMLRTAGALKGGFVALASRWALGTAIVAVLATVIAYGSQSRVELDLGSGRADAAAHRFASYDQEGGVSFRRALPGAALDLRDFGALSPWTVEVRARSRAAGGAGIRGTLLRAGDVELTEELTSEWGVYRVTLPAPPLAWRSGYWLEFPPGGWRGELEIDSVTIARGRSFPSLAAVAWIWASAWLLTVSLASCGLSPRSASLGVVPFLVLIAAGLVLEPETLPRVLPIFFFAAAGSLSLSALSRGFLSTWSETDSVPELGAWALAISSLGFVTWFLSMAFPLYVGGHFGYHTAIAEEIWQGQFLLYYLPEPGSMLSRQPQWGNVIVPHSCLFHTVVSPLAAFPSQAFHILTKLFLAALLFGISLTSALIATALGDRRTGTYAALVAVGLPTGYQLLGLGHLMTLFGCWAATLALGFIILMSARLSERLTYGIALLLLSLCFLSYTGSLLFASLSLAASAGLLIRKEPDLGRRLATLVLAGWAVSLVLYYGNWVLPFVRESLPSLLSGRGSESIDLVSRIAAEPRKMAYTFGSFLVPLVGLVGLFRLRGRNRVFLVSWAGILIAFSLPDVVFNFLLKHHYYSFPAIAIGVALASRWLEGKGRWGRIVVGVFLLYIGMNGLQEALLVSHGRF